MTVQKLELANDLGYSAMKAIANNNVTIKMPSVMAVQRSQDVFDSVDFNTLSDDDKSRYMSNLLDRLDVSVNTPSISTSQRMFIGTRAIESRLPLSTFDVNDLSGKSENDLSLILTLSLIGGESVYEYFVNHHTIPTELTVDVDMATALPVLEGKRNHSVNTYRDRFLNGPHEVILHNFTQPIKVKINFNRVIVALEGETAQYEIRYAIPQLASEIKGDFDSHYPELADKVSVQSLIKEGNVMGIDIGEGTTDYVVFSNGELNQNASDSIKFGYGKALEGALDELHSQKFNISSRSELQSFLSSTPSALNTMRHQIAQTAVDNQMNLLANNIIDAASKSLGKSSAGVNLIFVYGGGATPLESYLRKPLMEKTQQFAAGTDIPIIWISKNFAQFLNEGGLQVILSKL